jgi:hypothetical protein
MISTSCCSLFSFVFIDSTRDLYLKNPEKDTLAILQSISVPYLKCNLYIILNFSDLGIVSVF